MPPSPPDVTVVLPVWNGARFLAESASSILGQTFTNLELLIVDDGSTDDTPQTTAGLVRSDDRVTALTVDHRGLAEALNAGLAQTRSRYVARMDADDVALPTRIASQVAALEADPACVAVGCAVQVVDAGAHLLGDLRFPLGHDAIVEALLTGSPGLCHSAVTYRTEAVIGVGGYRSECFPAEDLDLWARLAAVGELANLPDVLQSYRRHVGAVGVRLRESQQKKTRDIRDAERGRRGLPPLRRWQPPLSRKPEAVYHYECGRVSLRGGRLRAARHHAREGIREAPYWTHNYAILLASALPPELLSRSWGPLGRLRRL